MPSSRTQLEDDHIQNIHSSKPTYVRMDIYTHIHLLTYKQKKNEKKSTKEEMGDTYMMGGSRQEQQSFDAGKKIAVGRKRGRDQRGGKRRKREGRIGELPATHIDLGLR